MRSVQDQQAGGQFLIGATAQGAVFTPEDFTDEHRMIRQLARDFAQKEVLPHNERLESQDWDFTVSLLKKAGNLGLLAHSVPEAYEGLGLDKITKVIVGEEIGQIGGYSVMHLNHTGIATLPITYFGTEEQKAKYLPKLASGEYLGAYCLTEPAAGSDALGAKTTAKLNAAGTHYVLNGTKQFITNAGFADTFIVYAKVDGTQFTAFLVEKNFPGLSLGPEENKMGIKSSSTRQVFLEDCLVPVENLLGEVGRGHVIAFNVLNLGRFNLGAAALGGAKAAFAEGLRYSKSRVQFNRPLSSLPATQEKLATMAARLYAMESLEYRTAHLLEDALGGLYEETDPRVLAKALMEYAIECSICKVFGSETLQATVDESLQLHGGYGYMREYRIEQMYRDARINRVYEGTNEVNRLLVPGLLIKKASAGALPVSDAIERATAELFGEAPTAEGPQSRERDMVSAVRRVFLTLLGLAYEEHQERLEAEQETVMKLSELGIQLYAMESALLRTERAIARNGEEREALKRDLTVAFVDDAFLQGEMLARQVLVNLLTADRVGQFRTLIPQQFARFYPDGTVDRKRRIAKRQIEADSYSC
ncbi:acyl-CoA dehydrogenase family protein [Tumebacillus permanentifrigoris]|uniref:Alkylation response protein AidB-like acyl-CoA dehydrogenase n=1 Tax=Tumebacillus permanentifrigoris TaxID=378543 RepID=A0A316DDW5_9BACL|nr:acyl-CoA dehydrogenase family protein [Tumebacillus permanentifrigoris]PWK15712.1 alkylation response protein AidB-like acyl-CoA dehydrogenase [Tumebacillus permanentifrigoris]